MQVTHLLHKYGQALVELAVFGSILLIIAAVAVSIIMRNLIQQRVMIENFERAKRFARQAGVTGAPVTHTLIEHVKIPSFISPILSNPTEFQDTISLIWSWNCFWVEPGDPSETVRLVKIIVDGKNLADVLNINQKREVAGREGRIKNRLPRALRAKMGEFFVLDFEPLEEIRKRIKPALGKVTADVKDKLERVSELMNMVEDGEKRWKDVEQEVIDCVREARNMTNDNYSVCIAGCSRASGSYCGCDSVALALDALRSAYDYLMSKKWENDFGDGMGFQLSFSQKDTREIDIVSSLDKGTATVSSGFCIKKRFVTHYGNFDVSWISGEEKYEWK